MAIIFITALFFLKAVNGQKLFSLLNFIILVTPRLLNDLLFELFNLVMNEVKID